MRKTLTLSAVIILAFLSVAAIKFFTDYPNSVPADSDFFVLQRNQSYINASQGQVRGSWFNNPAFTGNGSISGAFGVGGFLTAGGVIYGNGSGLTNVNGFSSNATFITLNVTTNVSLYETNFVLVTTNVTVEQPGGLTNLNLTPLSLMWSDANDAEASIPNAAGILTNNGSGGIGFNLSIALDEVDVTDAYFTNFFTGLTNYAQLGTDSNGKLTLGSSTITNISITNLYAETITNNTFVNTNTVIISGKASVNTLIVTNVAVYGNLTNANATASTVAAYDANKVLGSLANAYGVLTNSGSAIGYNSVYPQGDGAALTNLTYQYKTNAVSNGALTFGEAYRTNISADITLASYTLGPNGASMYESLVILVTNSDTSVHKITHPSGVFSGGVAAVSWITNGYWNEVVVDHFATLYTNAQVKN